jgi:hypothetical protein
MTTNRQVSPALESLAALRLGTDSKGPVRSQPLPAAPGLDKVLAEAGPLPREALFLGVASDGLPVLLNLHDPVPGSMLIIGEPGAGKTAFLQSIARSLAHTHTEHELQFGVITSQVDEWEKVEKSPHQMGVFDVNQTAAQDFILSLASWAHTNRKVGGSVLVLVDDLEALAKMELGALQNFRWLLLRGPARRVWPIITLNADRYGQVLAWLELFRSRIFGRVKNPQTARTLCGDDSAALDQLEAGIQFSLRENGGWLRFCIPNF